MALGISFNFVFVYVWLCWMTSHWPKWAQASSQARSFGVDSPLFSCCQSPILSCELVKCDSEDVSVERVARERRASKRCSSRRTCWPPWQAQVAATSLSHRNGGLSWRLPALPSTPTDTISTSTGPLLQAGHISRYIFPIEWAPLYPNKISITTLTYSLLESGLFSDNNWRVNSKNQQVTEPNFLGKWKKTTVYYKYMFI